MQRVLALVMATCIALASLTACGKQPAQTEEFPFTEQEMVRLGIVCATHVWGDELTDYLSEDLYQQFKALPDPEGAVLDISYDEFMNVLDETITWTDTLNQVYSSDGVVSTLMAYGDETNPTYLYITGKLNSDNKFSELSIYSGTDTVR